MNSAPSSLDSKQPPAESNDLTLSARISRIAQDPRFLLLAPPLALVLATFVILAQYGPFERQITHDPGIFAYLAQNVALGFAPHKFAFNEQASLAFLFGGAAMRVGDLFGLHHLISFRLASMAVVAAVVVLTYVVATRFTRSRAIAFLAGLILLGFEGYNVRAATTLEPKSFMLVFGLATLYLLSRRKWFWAGLFAMAAGLAWQIAWGYLIVAILLAAIQGGRSRQARARAVGLTLAAALGAFALYEFYFVLQNAHIEMLQQTFLAPLVMRRASKVTLDERSVRMAYTFYVGFGTHILFGVLAVAGLIGWLGAHTRPWEPRAFLRRAAYFLFQNRRTAGSCLVVAGFLLYSFLDFQNYPDWFPLLPFISIFAAWMIWQIFLYAVAKLRVPAHRRALAVGALIVGVLALSTFHAFFHTWRDNPNKWRSWREQQQVADAVNAKLEPDDAVWVLGKAEFLFFMQRVNLNKYFYLFGQVDAAADAFEPGGLDGVFRAAEAQQPVLYALARIAPKKYAKKSNFQAVNRPWANYVLLDRCKRLANGRYFVRGDKLDELFPVGAEGCLKRAAKQD